MFEEKDNIFPAKPVLINGDVQNKGAKIMFLVFAFVFVSINYFSETYVLLLELILVLFLHEMGHYLMMRIYKRKTQGLFFMTFLTSLTSSFATTTSEKKHIVINFMGPLLGLIIGSVLFCLSVVGSPNIYLVELSLLFIGINIINLAPLDPLDGGRIISILFFYRNDRFRMIFVLISSITIILIGFFTNLYVLIIFGFLMGLKVRSFQKSMLLHEELEEQDVNFKKEYNELTNKEYWEIRSAFLRKNPKLKELIPSGYTLWENERLLMEQVRQLLRLEFKHKLPFIGKLTVLVCLLLFIGLPLLLIYSNPEIIEWYIEHAEF